MMTNATIVLACSAALAVGAHCGGQAREAGSQAAPRESASRARPEVPPEILTRLATCEISVTYSPGAEDPGPGLRNVSLYVSQNLRLEPPGLWPDGTPISADLVIPEATARILLDLLAERAFFSRATRHHTERRVPPGTPPPADSTEGRPAPPPEPNVTVEVRVNDDDWHYMRIASWPTDDQVRALIQAMEEAAGGEAAEALAELRAEI